MLKHYGEKLWVPNSVVWCLTTAAWVTTWGSSQEVPQYFRDSADMPPTPGHLVSPVSSLQGHTREWTRGHLTTVIVCLERGATSRGSPHFQPWGPAGARIPAEIDGQMASSSGPPRPEADLQPGVSLCVQWVVLQAPFPLWAEPQARWRRHHKVPSGPFLAPPALNTTLPNAALCVSLDAGCKQALTCACKGGWGRPGPSSASWKVPVTHAKSKPVLFSNRQRRHNLGTNTFLAKEP